MGKNTKANKTTKNISNKKTSKKRRYKDDNEVEEKTPDESFKGQETNESNSKNATEEENEVSQYSEASETKKSKRNKKTKDDTVTKSKKIVLDSNESEELKIKFIKPEKIRRINDDEAEVKDEDIDKFCEELDDEDNAHYENWVQQIEANFRSNKKKT